MSIVTALAIAKAAGLGGWIVDKLKGSDSGAAKLAGKVIEFATETTGYSSPSEALASLKGNSAALQAFKDKVLEKEHELKKLVFADRKDARQMYKEDHSQTNKIAERIMTWNLPAIILLLIANAFAAHYFKDNTTLLLTIGNFIGMAVKSLFDERTNVIGFFFGSSMGSKQKDQERNK